MARYRAAVIGLGRIASTIDEEMGPYDKAWLPYAHIACHMAAPEIQLVGMADTWAEQREAARRKWSFDQVFDDYRQMLRATKPEIVSVCTSAKPRGDILLEIAAGGYGVKAIWAEKPLTHSLAQADQVIEACRRNGIVLAVNTQRRSSEIYRLALQLVQDGVLGEVLHIQALGQCGISHNGSHLLTTLTMFVGARATWVMGEAQDLSGDNDFHGAGYLGFANGVRGYFRGMPNGPNEWAVDVTGVRGMIRLMQDGRAVEHWTHEPAAPGSRRDAVARRFFPLPPVRRSPSLNTLYNLMVCLETGAAPNCSGEDAREALEIGIATRESHRRGNVRVDLPLADRSLQIVSAEVVRSELPRAILRQREAQATGGR
ncbi:MAG: Gfo/Idh/MocA family oxidoreductase [Actinobacteria bacterium]|nr:Gfo/Idh/MocA family oxidoreductase [Actinomycetota bacterium]